MAQAKKRALAKRPKVTAERFEQADEKPEPDRVIDYDALRPIAIASNLLEVVPTHFSAGSTGPLGRVDGRSVQHEIRFRGTPHMESFEEGVVLASVEFEYQAIEPTSKKTLCSVHGAFMVIYGLQRDRFETTADTAALFAELHGMHHAWPYIRELVGSLASRLGLCGVLLPLWQPPKVLPPRGQYVSMSTRPSQEAEG